MAANTTDLIGAGLAVAGALMIVGFAHRAL
jgi:hypothetical protein